MVQQKKNLFNVETKKEIIKEAEDKFQFFKKHRKASMVAQKLSAIVGDRGSIPESGRFPGEGNGNPLQSSCLENPHEQRSLLGCNGVAKSQTQQLK